MFYDRKIKYLDYYENGERVRGGGFLKVEVRDGFIQIDLSVTGLYPTDVFERDVVLCGDNRESCIGKIAVSGGKGKSRWRCHDIDDLWDTGISYEELQGLRIPLGAGRELSGRWERMRTAGPHTAAAVAKKISPGSAAMKEMERARIGGMTARRIQAAQIGGTTAEEISAVQAGDTAAEKAESVRTGKASAVQTGVMAAEQAQSTQAREPASEKLSCVEKGTSEGDRRSGEEKAGASGKTIPLLEDKWQQLYAIYPHIRPFRDEREYISIRPADFILFPAESYKLLNNSFLLHGYYNYRHLLLARMERKGQTYYYVGVPGSYYEKEKQVAIMFGFESFECAEEPAQAGDFGYYMMRTEL